MDKQLLDTITFFNYKIEINKDTKHTDNICSFKGNINILFDEAGIIYDWKWELTNVLVDLLTTKSWQNGPKWIKRIEMFNFIDPILQIEIRENKSDHKIQKLNQNQIQNLNNYLNKEINTLKNIITFLKGSNPSGERQNPQASEVKAILNGKEINFALFFKNNNYFKNNKHFNFEFYWMNSIENNYFHLLKGIKLDKVFKFNGIEKNNLYDLLLITSDKNFKNYYEKWKNNLEMNLKNNQSHVKKIDENIKQARNEYYKNINKDYDNYKVWDLPKDEIQRAHIISAKHIRYELIKTFYTKFSIFDEEKQRLLEIISDPNNFLNFPNSIHQKFDQIKFNYDYQTGEIDIIGAQILHFNKSLNNIEIYSNIPKNKLNSKRANYLKLRAQILNSSGKSTL